MTLRAGVIAAGRGERLRGASQPLKPLVPVAGVTLVERVLTALGETAPSEIAIIINDAALAVRDHVAARRWPFALRWIVESTPSSMHSFLRIVETLAEDGAEGPFLISTVDTVARPGAYARFMADAQRQADAAITLALTPVPDDDRPLLVRLDGSTVVALGDAAASAPYATAGYYAVRPSILAEADEARRDGVTSLRAFLGRMLVRGYRLAGVPSSESIDVDRPRDVDAAEDFLRRVPG